MSSSSEYQAGYSRETLLRYLSGQMSPAEMHALEKAALEDPFLADALDGLKQETSSQLKNDLDSLDQQLINRTDPKIIPMPPRIKWWRVAIVASIIGLMGLSYYLYTNLDEEPPVIAQLSEKVTTDSINKDKEAIIRYDSTTAAEAEKFRDEEDDKSIQISTSENNNPDPAKTKMAEKVPPLQIQAPPASDKGLPKNAEAEAGRVSNAQVTLEENALNQPARPEKVSRARVQRPVESEKGPALFYFVGRVTDMHQNPVAFANIAFRHSQRSNYTDANGNFKILAGDSTVQVDIKSVGYQPRSVRLTNNQPMHQVMLQAAPYSKKKALAKTLENKSMDSEIKEKSDPELEKPDAEPRDGFAAYQFYLLNNVRIPAEARERSIKGVVELSFLVGDNGRLSDFKIEKSLCHSCDKEAIRLIKDGPPWILYNSDLPVRSRITVIF
jgi:TonB family protein